MDIYLIKSNSNCGPYSESEVITRLKEGRTAKTDLAWCSGLAHPVPLIEILCEAPPEKASLTDATLSHGELRTLAENYRNLLAVAVVWCVGFFIPMSDSFQRIWILALGGCWIRFGWNLYRILDRKPWVWVIWSLIPIGNFYALVRILCAAYRTLKANGVAFKCFCPEQTAIARLIEAEKADTRD